jgi:hypothetical protein
VSKEAAKMVLADDNFATVRGVSRLLCCASVAWQCSSGLATHLLLSVLARAATPHTHQPPKLATQIVAAVREGRRVWDNLRKILLFNLPVNFAQGGAICESRYAPYMPSCNLACKSSGGKRMPRIVLMQFAKTLHS